MHIFDVDHTLVSGSSGRRFIVTAIKEGVLRRSVLLSLPMVYLRYRLGRLKPAHINRDLPAVIGLSREELERIARETFEHELKQAVFDDAKKYIEKLHSQSAKIAIATSSVDIIVEPLASYLGIDTIISSSMEFDSEGLCTGRFLNAPLFSDEKREKVLSFLDESSIDPNECSFYSDSIYDLPLLESVGKPVAINPDFMLARHAKKQNWEIMRFG